MQLVDFKSGPTGISSENLSSDPRLAAIIEDEIKGALEAFLTPSGDVPVMLEMDSEGFRVTLLLEGTEAQYIEDPETVFEQFIETASPEQAAKMADLLSGWAERFRAAASEPSSSPSP